MASINARRKPARNGGASAWLTDAVEDFYPRNVVVSRLAELPSTVFSVLSSMLLTR
ncbi:hypothetical protein [Paraburkholderia ultramafica]|uniref:hypothetical protein n=1 Tax=Paraburkholderia ultramafica TaxID=1544867 RepID=UPI001583121C|nr:hypothetical protein [Paraburkholderia ultramafica]